VAFFRRKFGWTNLNDIYAVAQFLKLYVAVKHFTRSDGINFEALSVKYSECASVFIPQLLGTENAFFPRSIILSSVVSLAVPCFSTLSQAARFSGKIYCTWKAGIGHILRRNCLLKQVIERKIKGEMEVTRCCGRKRMKLLDDLKDRRGYCHLKEEALDRTVWRNRFGGGFEPVVRRNIEWMNASLQLYTYYAMLTWAPTV
jgi:hypothetical protein